MSGVFSVKEFTGGGVILWLLMLVFLLYMSVFLVFKQVFFLNMSGDYECICVFCLSMSGNYECIFRMIMLFFFFSVYKKLLLFFSICVVFMGVFESLCMVVIKNFSVFCVSMGVRIRWWFYLSGYLEPMSFEWLWVCNWVFSGGYVGLWVVFLA